MANVHPHKTGLFTKERKGTLNLGDDALENVMPAPPPTHRAFPKRLAVTFMAAALLGAAAWWTVGNWMIQQQALSHAAALARALAPNAEDDLLTGNPIQLRLFTANATRQPGVIGVWVLDAQAARVAGPEGEGAPSAPSDLDQGFAPWEGTLWRRVAAPDGDAWLVELKLEVTSRSAGRGVGWVLVRVDPRYINPATLTGWRILGIVLGLLWLLSLAVAVALWAFAASSLEREALRVARRESVMEWLLHWEEEVPLVVTVQKKRK